MTLIKDHVIVAWDVNAICVQKYLYFLLSDKVGVCYCFCNMIAEFINGHFYYILYTISCSMRTKSLIIEFLKELTYSIFNLNQFCGL